VDGIPTEVITAITGSGATAAILFWMLNHYMKRQADDAKEYAAQNREDKLRLADVLEKTTATITQLSIAIHELRTEFRETRRHHEN
jgi:hypothetical protein